MLVRHFTRAGAEWEVSAALRSMVTTSTLNLAQPYPRMGPFDVVFLRNVLIYFDVPTKQDILRKVRAPDAPRRLAVPGGRGDHARGSTPGGSASRSAAPLPTAPSADPPSRNGE